eukprot:TRINITY_DN24223_c0_g1_i3.p1 TRINITY_DN24223_c0_g1~~TRINITY_DN24223_c0_g1_i3.p1  ORF type:complete len:510 (+),score=45.84 TRINITY_DN24223_c0_g1_i3:94-1623(+)
MRVPYNYAAIAHVPRVAGGGVQNDFSFLRYTFRRLVIFCGAAFFRILPEKRTPSYLQIAQSIATVFIISRLLATTDLRTLRDHEAFDTMISFVLSTFAGGPLLTTFLASLTCLCRIGKYIAFLRSMSAVDREQISRLHGSDHLATYTLEHIAVVASTVFMASILEASMLEGALASLRERVWYQIQEVVQSLLAVLCDAVVCTDEDFLLTEPSLALANTLLRQPPGNSYEGHCFLEFVEESDRQRVHAHFANSGLGTAQSIHTRVLDGNSNQIAVQLYCVPFQNIHGQRCHIIGMKEGDGATVDVVPAQPSRQLFDAYRCTRGRPRGPDALDEESSLVSSADSSSTRWSSASANAQEEAVVYLHADSMEVITWNAAFTILSGPEQEQGFSFIDWLQPPQAQQVPRTIREACEKFMSDPNQSDQPALVPLGALVLQPPQAQRAGLKYTVETHLDLQPLTGKSSNHASSFVRLVLSDLKNVVKPKRAWSPRPRPRSETSSEAGPVERPMVAL